MLTTAFTVVSDTAHIIQGQIRLALKVVIIGTTNIRKNILFKYYFSYNLLLFLFNLILRIRNFDNQI